MKGHCHGSGQRYGLMLISLAIFFLSAGFLLSQVAVTDLCGPYLGQDEPGTVPRMFVPADLRSNAEWWWHGAPAFSPDGREFYLDIFLANQGIYVQFMEMNLDDDRWTSPQAPGFAASFMTASPSFTADGNKVFFLSDRPGGFVWTSSRITNGWSEPQSIHFPTPPSLGFGWRVSADKTETLYMRMTDSLVNTGLDIYQIRKVNGAYLQPERMDDNINSPYTDLGAFVDPDGRFLIFESDRPGGYGSRDLYISYREPDGSWAPAVNMGESINSSSDEGSPYVSPDGRFLFFLSDRPPQNSRDPYWVDSLGVIDHPHPDEPPRPRRPSGRRRPTESGP